MLGNRVWATFTFLINTISLIKRSRHFQSSLKLESFHIRSHQPLLQHFLAVNSVKNHAHTHAHVQWPFFRDCPVRWQRHQLGSTQVCTSLQTDNHARTPPLTGILQAGCPSCCPTNSVKALKANSFTTFTTDMNFDTALITQLQRTELNRTKQNFFWH